MGRYVAKLACEVGRSALFEVRVGFGHQNLSKSPFSTVEMVSFDGFRSALANEASEASFQHAYKKLQRYRSSSTSRTKKGTPTDPSGETDGIVASRAGKRVSRQARSIEGVQRNTESHFLRTIHSRFDCLRRLHGHVQRHLSVCFLEQGAQG